MKAEIIWLFKGICFFRESVAVKYENGLIKFIICKTQFLLINLLWLVNVSWFQHFSRNKS